MRCEYTTLLEATTRYAQIKCEAFKDLATEWRAKIDPRAYEALMSYEVKI